MTAPRILTFRAAVALATALGCCTAQASDPWPDPRPIARDTPAFRAPVKPPEAVPDETALIPEPAGPLALQDALALALMRNPELEEFSWEARAGEARELQARKIPNPELDIRLWRVPKESGLLDVTRKRVILSQLLELGSKRHRRVVLAQAERDMAGWDYEAKRIEVATVVAMNFVAVLGAQRRVEAMRDFLEHVERISGNVSKLVETGAMPGVETHRVTRQTGLARIELRRAETELSSARFKLAATWGNSSPRFTEAVGDLEHLPPIPDIDTVIGIAERSPAMSRWESELARSTAALAVARASRTPDLKFGAGVRWVDGVDQEDYILDFEIDLPIFDRKQGDVRAARYNLAKARSGQAAARAAGAAGIAEFYYTVLESRARSATLDGEVIPATRAAVESFQLAFDTQADNLDDLLDASRDLARAELEYTDALLDYHQALATLESLVGASLTGGE